MVTSVILFLYFSHTKHSFIQTFTHQSLIPFHSLGATRGFELGPAVQHANALPHPNLSYAAPKNVCSLTLLQQWLL